MENQKNFKRKSSENISNISQKNSQNQNQESLQSISYKTPTEMGSPNIFPLPQITSNKKQVALNYAQTPSARLEVIKSSKDTTPPHYSKRSNPKKSNLKNIFNLKKSSKLKVKEKNEILQKKEMEFQVERIEEEEDNNESDGCPINPSVEVVSQMEMSEPSMIEEFHHENPNYDDLKSVTSLEIEYFQTEIEKYVSLIYQEIPKERLENVDLDILIALVLSKRKIMNVEGLVNLVEKELQDINDRDLILDLNLILKKIFSFE